MKRQRNVFKEQDGWRERKKNDEEKKVIEGRQEGMQKRRKVVEK